MTWSMNFGWLLVTTALCSTALAADVYRWIDENGRTQISDQPPPQGARSVTRAPLDKQEVLPADRRAAQERTARDLAAAKRMENERRLATAQAAQPKPGASAAADGARLPPRGTGEDCRKRRQDYAKSQICFAPYRTAGGGIKSEAYAACGPEVLDPSQECGLPRN